MKLDLNFLKKYQNVSLPEKLKLIVGYYDHNSELYWAVKGFIDMEKFYSNTNASQLPMEAIKTLEADLTRQVLDLYFDNCKEPAFNMVRFLRNEPQND